MSSVTDLMSVCIARSAAVPRASWTFAFENLISVLKKHLKNSNHKAVAESMFKKHWAQKMLHLVLGGGRSQRVSG